MQDEPNAGMEELDEATLAGVSGGTQNQKVIEGGTPEDPEEYADASKDRRGSGIDNIQKLLDLVRGIKPQI